MILTLFLLSNQHQICIYTFLRVPDWCEKATLKVNGEPVQGTWKANTYAEVNHIWKKGDLSLIHIYPIEENTEEDNWRFVEASQAKTPLKPVIADEPISEDIPQGLHDPNETRWNQHDVRRYAYRCV